MKIKTKIIQLLLSVTPSFEPLRGKVLACPKGAEILILNTSTWEQHKVLKHSKVSSEYTYCAFSPCGEYLAAGTESGEVVIWNYKTGEAMEGEVTSIDTYPVTGLSWHPKNNGELVICDNQGQLGNVECTFANYGGADDGEIDDGNDLMTMAEKEANALEDDDKDMDLDEMYTTRKMFSLFSMHSNRHVYLFQMLLVKNCWQMIRTMRTVSRLAS